jgi:hypothetical protein
VRPVEQASFAVYRERVVGLSSKGAAMARIEQLLGRAPLPSEQRDALWLLGWCLNERRDRRAGRPLTPSWAT